MGHPSEATSGDTSAFSKAQHGWLHFQKHKRALQHTSPNTMAGQNLFERLDVLLMSSNGRVQCFLGFVKPPNLCLLLIDAVLKAVEALAHQAILAFQSYRQLPFHRQFCLISFLHRFNFPVPPVCQIQSGHRGIQ